MAEYRADQYRTAFRATLHPDYEAISDEQADALLEQVTAALTPQEAEAYMEGLGSWLKHAARTVGKSAPIWAPIAGAAVGSIVPGVGTAIGGAVGGLAGNVAGRLAAGGKVSGGAVAGAALQGAAQVGLQAVGSRLPAPVAQVASAAVQAATAGSRRPAVAPAAHPSTPAPAGRPAAAQLLTLLHSPHFNRAVLGQVNGLVGRAAVPVRTGRRTHRVAFASFANALLQLAQQAVQELTAESEGSASYLTDGEGSYRYDPASPEQRAEGLLALLEAEYAESNPPVMQAEYAEVEAESFDPLTEWFLDSGLVRR